MRRATVDKDGAASFVGSPDIWTTASGMNPGVSNPQGRTPIDEDGGGTTHRRPGHRMHTRGTAVGVCRRKGSVPQTTLCWHVAMDEQCSCHQLSSEPWHAFAMSCSVMLRHSLSGPRLLLGRVRRSVGAHGQKLQVCFQSGLSYIFGVAAGLDTPAPLHLMVVEGSRPFTWSHLRSPTEDLA